MKIHLSEIRKVFGPAWLVMMADVDAASIITAIQTGASFKYEFIPILLALIIPLYFISEVAGRVGAATKKGLGELIRENFSRRWSVFLSFPMAITDFLSYVAEYTAIAVGFSIIGISPLIALPIVYIIHIAIVFRRKYEKAEKYLLVVSLVMLIAYLAMMGKGISDYGIFPHSINKLFLLLIAANVGAVIMPFMLFYQTSATAKKGYHSVQATKIETFVGAVFSQIIMIAIVVVSAGLGKGTVINTSHQLANAITSLGSSFTPAIFTIGLIAAGFLALVVISMASAWGIVEALDIKDKTWLKIYIIETLPAMIVPLLFNNLIALVLTLMVALVFVLIGPVVALGLIAEKKKLMREHTLKGASRLAFWISVMLVVMCGLLAFI
ncbi:MAG: divalent metal cation transporter [Candidatus Marsarchaeota archaeon]|jgi:Mn2+/Fe2+ NRAMP family transporter|nr:divalent metal cation transporter [Candidatus Marsarchaeota archaeon]